MADTLRVLLEHHLKKMKLPTVWSEHDKVATGRILRVLTVVDICSRMSPVIDRWFRYSGEDVVKTRERVCGKIGYPKTVRGD